MIILHGNNLRFNLNKDIMQNSFLQTSTSAPAPYPPMSYNNNNNNNGSTPPQTNKQSEGPDGANLFIYHIPSGQQKLMSFLFFSSVKYYRTGFSELSYW